jgi:RNA polymerase sigma-70 factor (ECF subfamily)
VNTTTIHVRRAKGGDRDSLAWLAGRFSPLLLAQARYRLRGRLAQWVQPEDVVQDVWAVALPALPGLEPRDGRETPVLLKFLATTLLYRVNDLTRRHIRERQRDCGSSSAPPTLSQLPADSRGALSRAAGEEEYRRIVQAIDELPEADRQVVVLRGIEQHSNQEAAEILGATPNAVSLRFNRVLERLRERLGASVLDELDEAP